MKRFLKSIICICMMLWMLSGMFLCAYASGVTVKHTFPASVKVGQYVSGTVTVSNLRPNERLYSAYYGFQAGDYWSTMPIGLSGGVGGESDPEDNYLYADENGKLIIPDSNMMMFTYKPGTLKGSARIMRDTIEESKWVMRVEEPVITCNTQSTVKVGSSITFKTALTNTAYKNSNINNHKENVPYYTPNVEVVEGKNIVKRSNQDYSNTLSTSEMLTFNKTGTVKLKITYRPTVYQTFLGANNGKIENWIKSNGYECVKNTGSSALIYLDGTIEKTVSIKVTENTTDISSNSTVSSEETTVSEESPQASNSQSESDVLSEEVSGKSVAITNEDTGIKIYADDDSFPDGTTIIANQILQGEKFDEVKDAFKDIADKFYIFDISLENDNTKVQPSGEVIVFIPIPENLDKSNLSVYYVDDKGNKTELNSTVEGEYISFKTDHFSTYVVAEKTANLLNQSTDEDNSSSLRIIIPVVLIVIIIILGIAIWYFKFRKK